MTQLTWLALMIMALRLFNSIKGMIKGEFPETPNLVTKAHISSAYFVIVIFNVIVICALFQRG